ncbi:hypothetical protein J1614_001768 [Plenodomus biglobosus]|nr:hypothetical protein J1614_001768 [Plenodomus biglobosus]
MMGDDGICSYYNVSPRLLGTLSQQTLRPVSRDYPTQSLGNGAHERTYGIAPTWSRTNVAEGHVYLPRHGYKATNFNSGFLNDTLELQTLAKRGQ